jgi:molybdopterin synthase sulfur carrier subunit
MAVFPAPRTLGISRERLIMSVEVRIPTILRSYTGGAKVVKVEGSDIAGVIGALDTAHAGIGERILDEAGLRRFMNVYLNDEDVRFLEGLQTPVATGDSITILPAVAGG